jgi:hypothetical protein
MQQTTSWLARAAWAVLVLLIGAVLLIVAFVQAGNIPRQAHDDFGALIQAHGGSMSHSATYPDTYRQMAAQSRLLQNAYLGLTGVALLTAGAIGVTAVTAGRRSEG